MFLNILFLLFALFVGPIFTVDFCVTKPKFIKTCEFADPEFVKCATNSIQGGFDQLVKGIEGLEDKVGPLDPMKLSEVNILQDGDSNNLISVNVGLSDIVITGLQDLKILENRVFLEDFRWETKISLPKLRVEANYHGQAQIFVMGLKGQGSAWFEPSDMDITMSTKTSLYQKSEHIFYNITDVKIDYKVQNFRMHMYNLFGDNEELEDKTNEFFIKNWRPVEKVLNPFIRQIIEGILLDIMQKVFHEIPADYFIKDLPADRAVSLDSN